ncbi:hypothetical protein CPB83DRAFT_842501 [Crepidotus variabilis]|uniref:Diaminopimelate epimerase-like protein n=1 Tax=Crepidotus variabilis TaxID=179855 RepID=A0A9P6JX41_9AGAR|nr:hypothetical protein CPB83DRAFT_842501 [Crepidotus variabilis]
MAVVSAPFALVTAFSTNITGGNPAAVVLHDTSRPLHELAALARTLNQPILAVVSSSPLPSDEPHVQIREIRYFASKNGDEQRICGHGMLATASVIFSLSEFASTGLRTIIFKNPIYGLSFRAMATKLDDGFIEISLPAPSLGEVDENKKMAIRSHVNKAFGREVKIKDIKTGGTLLPHYCLIVLDEKEILAGSTIHASALIETGFVIHVVTIKSPDPEYVFYSRMFAPLALIDPGEDAVCGSAHGISGPYWHEQLGIQAGTEIKAKQVSERGGHVRLIWDVAEGFVRLRGQATVLASGTVQVPFGLPQG